MKGMCAETGRLLQGDDHLNQSIENIITTIKKTLVLRRDYGSDCGLLKDKSTNPSTLMLFYACIAESIRVWEPRLLLRRVLAKRVGEGGLFIEIHADVREYKSQKIIGSHVKIDVPLVWNGEGAGEGARAARRGVTTYTFVGDEAYVLPYEPQGRIDVFVNGSRLSKLDSITLEGARVIIQDYTGKPEDVIEVDVHESI